jgi:DNA replication initiation complex subunit (GINS family)
LEIRWQILFNISIDVIREKEMDENEINYKNLRKIQQIEKESPALTKIESSFYTALSDYLKYLDTRLEKESSPQKQMLLKEEVQNTRKISTNIYEQREKKVILAAISKTRGGEPDLKNLVGVERNLFDSILQMMAQTREELLNKKTREKEEEKAIEVRIEPKAENKKQEIITQKPQNINPIVMVAKDIPEFMGTDAKKYNLRKGDVLSLPKDMSDTLSKRDAVKEMKK